MSSMHPRSAEETRRRELHARARAWLPLLGLSLLLFATSCGGLPGTAFEKDKDDLADADSTVMVVLDDEVKWAIQLIDHRQQILADGRLKAQVRFVNRSPNDMHVQISWTFKDDHHFAVEPATPFAHYMVASGQTVDLTQESIAAGAVEFVIQMKTAKPASR